MKFSRSKKKSSSLNFTHLEKKRKIWKIEKLREKNIEKLREKNIEKLGKKSSPIGMTLICSPPCDTVFYFVWVTAVCAMPLFSALACCCCSGLRRKSHTQNLEISPVCCGCQQYLSCLFVPADGEILPLSVLPPLPLSPPCAPKRRRFAATAKERARRSTPYQRGDASFLRGESTSGVLHRRGRRC